MPTVCLILGKWHYKWRLRNNSPIRNTFGCFYSSRWDKKDDSGKPKEEKKEANGDASSKEKSSAVKSPKRDSSPKQEAVTAPAPAAPAVKQEKVEPPPKKERSDRGERGHSRDRKSSRRSDRWDSHPVEHCIASKLFLCKWKHHRIFVNNDILKLILSPPLPPLPHPSVKHLVETSRCTDGVMVINL